MMRIETSRWKTLFAAAGVWVILLASAHAQTGGGGMPAAEKLVQVSAAPVSVAAGGSAVATLELTILSSWHVNANPPAQEYNIPTKISIAPAGGLTPGRVKYPPGKKFAFEGEPLLVYDDAVAVTVPITATAAATSQTLKGTIEYQACNNEVCLAPVRVPFTVQVNVTTAAAGSAAPPRVDGAAPEIAATTGRDTTTTPRNGFNVFASPPRPGGSNAGTVQNQLEAALARGGIGWLVALFVGGLLLNLTPCVFPMLGVTVSIFGARRKEPVPKVVTTAVLYVLGICVTYTALGVAAALTGGLFGAALQSIWVNVGLGALMILLSLGMFGVYEMQPPTWVMDRLGGAQATSFAGAFLSGLGVGIIAAPCVGPFVVAVLAVIAQRGSVGFGVQTMFTLSLGLGFPYLFLASFSNLLQALPRSGDWMVWVKHALGTLLAAIGLYYLGVGLLPEAAPWVLPVALTLGGLWLGFVDLSAGKKGKFRVFATVAGGLALFAGVFVGGRMYTAAQRTLRFKPYDAAAVSASIAAGRPVMMDFSADWCLPCHEMELNTLSDERVVAAAKAFDRYKVNLTKYDSPEAAAVRRQYRITGVPIIVFLGKDGAEVADARVDGFMPPERFLEQMRLGGAR